MSERRREVSKNTGWGFWGEEGLHFPLTRAETKQLVRSALEEDDTMHDVTTIATVVSDRRAPCTVAFGFASIWINRQNLPDEYAELSPRAVLSSLDGLS